MYYFHRTARRVLSFIVAIQFLLTLYIFLIYLFLHFSRVRREELYIKSYVGFKDKTSMKKYNKLILLRLSGSGINQ